MGGRQGPKESTGTLGKACFDPHRPRLQYATKNLDPRAKKCDFSDFKSKFVADRNFWWQQKFYFLKIDELSFILHTSTAP